LVPRRTSISLLSRFSRLQQESPLCFSPIDTCLRRSNRRDGHQLPVRPQPRSRRIHPLPLLSCFLFLHDARPRPPHAHPHRRPPLRPRPLLWRHRQLPSVRNQLSRGLHGQAAPPSRRATLQRKCCRRRSGPAHRCHETQG